MQISPFQFSVDLGTACSVLGACFLFFSNRRKYLVNLHRNDISKEYLIYSRKLIEFISKFERAYQDQSTVSYNIDADPNYLIQLVNEIILYSDLVAVPALKINNDKVKVIEMTELVTSLKKWNENFVVGFIAKKPEYIKYKEPGKIVGEIYSGILK